MTSYRDAGVRVEAADELIKSIDAEVTSTWGDKVTGAFGGFAAGVEIPAGYENPVLMMSTDGVGTKVELARRSGRWGGVGHDLVAMCVDDLAAVGAAPLGFVDYLAVGSLDFARDRAIIASIAEACSVAGCPLLGGETAEHPGVMPSDGVDLAGAAMGVVEKGAELGPHRVQDGDAVIGLSSPNLRSNGFSLVRAVLGDDLDTHLPSLLEPSVIYSPSVIRLSGSGALHAAAHITGGGLVANLGRVIPDGLETTIDTKAWERPAVFDLVSSAGVTEEEMFRTFNMGIGFCLVADSSGADQVMDSVSEHDPVLIGTVMPGEGVRLS